MCVCECVRSYRIVIDVNLDDLFEDVDNLGFELGVESSVAETEMITKGV